MKKKYPKSKEWKRQERKRRREKYKFSKNNHKKYTAEEEKLIRDYTYSTSQLALKLQRSLKAIETKRQQLKRKARKDER